MLWMILIPLAAAAAAPLLHRLLRAHVAALLAVVPIGLGTLVVQAAHRVEHGATSRGPRSGGGVAQAARRHVAATKERWICMER